MCEGPHHLLRVRAAATEIERRRKLIKVLDEAANKAVGYRGELKNIVIFKYHDDEACGVDGVLRADAKAAAEK